MLEVRVKSALDVVKHKLGRLLLQLVPEVPERPTATRIEQRTVEAQGRPDPEEEVSHDSRTGRDGAVAQDARSRPGERPGVATGERVAGEQAMAGTALAGTREERGVGEEGKR